MTQGPAATRKSDYRSRQAWIRARDLFNTYACASDPQLVASLDKAFRKALESAYASCAKQGGGLDLYVDGSWNEEKQAAGIGVAVITDPAALPWEEPNRMMGKPVRASSSAEAEIYAVAVGLSYVLDTFPGTRSVRLRYDCVSSPVCAANLDAYAGKGAPYTNLRSAMRRARKAGMNVAFEHVKAHASDRANGACDTLARHYAKAAMGRSQMHAADEILAGIAIRKED